ncbi:MAG: hypothetical protein KF902_00160 [Phycisphaeraceae bacterium]|nr:hypothetical protein [Phycisphaeraceae bacterium]
MRTVLSVGACGVLALVVAVLGSHAIELSRLDVVDERVRAVAEGVSRRVPDFSGLVLFNETGCRVYPVIQRFTLNEVMVSGTDRVLTPLEAYRATSATAEMIAPLFLGLLGSSLVWSLSIMRGQSGASVAARSLPLPSLMFRSLVASSPFVLVASALYWPIVSFWGTLAFDIVDTRGLNPPILDSGPTRIAIGAGLWSMCACAGTALLRKSLSRAGRASQPERSESATVDAPWWARESERVGFGGRFWRAARGSLIGLATIGLVCAPMVAGVVKATMG